MPEITIYTDGSALGNPGPGGYGAVLISGRFRKEVSQGYRLTTNNRMELMAVIAALKRLKEPCEVRLYSDSQYVVGAFANRWVESWQRNGWRTANKGEVKNVDLWTELIALTRMHKVEFIKVKGHADNEFNNRCDKLAREECKRFLPE